MTIDGRLAEVRARAERLAAASWLPGFVTPDYAASCISNLPGAIAGLFGVPAPAAGCLPIALSDGAPRRVLLIVLDAFGLELFLRAVPVVPPLARLVDRGRVTPLTSVFPSTTNVALTSLYTGMTPVAHGMVGLLIYLRQLGLIANLLRFHAADGGTPETLSARGHDPRLLFPVTTLFERLAAAEVSGIVVTRHSIHGTSLARIHHAGATVATYLTSSDLCVTLRRLLEADAGPRFLFAYWDLIDTLSHRHGPAADEVTAEAASFFMTLEREVLERLPATARRDTLLLIAADHGHLPMPGDSGITLERYPQVTDCLMMPPTGGARYPYFTAVPGRGAELREHLQPLGDQFSLLDAGDALERGLFGPGPADPDVRSRIGDVIGLARGDAALWRPETPTEIRQIRGLHGGLSEAEMLVPLLCVELDAI